MEIFKFAVFSSEEARSHGVKALYPVDQRWYHIAKATPDLWTKITFTYPLHPGQLSVAREWLTTSKPKTIDIGIDLCDRDWNVGEEDWHPLADPALLQDVIRDLRGSEHRWRSISIKSNNRTPVHGFLRAWAIPSLPALESISLDGFSKFLGTEYAYYLPDRFIGWPVLFSGDGTLMPKLREVSLSAIHVDWTPAVTTSFRNLRKMEIKNQPNGIGPSVEQFAELAAASPRLETLDVSGYCPDLPIQTRIPFVHLPALKHFIFGWNSVELAYNFLMMFQIPETLETLSLLHVESGLGVCQAEYSEHYVHSDDSSRIFRLLADLLSKNSKDKDPSKPWISILGLKVLSVSWVACYSVEVATFLQNAPKIEEVRLTDVGQEVIEGVATFAVETQSTRSLKRAYIRWIWNDGYESEEARVFTNILEELGLQVTVKKFKGKGNRFMELTPIALEAQVVREVTEPTS